MANHAYLVGTVDMVQVDEMARKFCEGPLCGLFELINLSDHRRLVLREDPGNWEYYLCFWKSTTKVPCPNDSDVEWDDLPDTPCLEVRHGHGPDFMWWLDFYFENWMAYRLGLRVMDDADGVVRDPQEPYDCPRYRDWMLKRTWARPHGMVSQMLNWAFARCLLVCDTTRTTYPSLRRAFYDKVSCAV